MLAEQIRQDLVAAQKDKNKVRTLILRFVLSRLSYAKIEKGRDLSDEEVKTEIAKEVKRHRESIEAFTKGNRLELAEKENQELTILQSYLPEQMSEEELQMVVSQTITDLGASSKQDMGKVIGAVMAKVKGKAQGGSVSKLVAEKLAS